MKLSDAAYDAYRRLTRTAVFYVVDTEYTKPDADDPVRSSRLISIAVQPVINGKRGTALYVEMNPTVPVSKATTDKTGFTTEAVAGKRPFGFYAGRILAAFDDPAGVFVSHTGADLRVLRGELERQATAGGKLGITDLPDLGVIDTALLPRRLRLPGLSTSAGTVSLADLCALVGVKFDRGRAHDARYDARVTADALLELLAHAAASGYVSLNDLLADHGRGTMGTPAASGTYTSAPETHPPLPDEHLARHGQIVLTDQADDEDLRALTELARECVSLRCQYLTDEAQGARIVAARVLPDLWGLLAKCTEPGQAGTLLGAVALLFPDAVDSTRAVSWWSGHKAAVAHGVRCGDTRYDACPACRESRSCPIDVLYTTVAAHATLCGQPALTKQTVKYKLFSAPAKKDRRVRDWSRSHPELAGYMAWMVIEWERDNGGARFAAKYLNAAVSFDLHKVEPRFGLLYADHLARSGKTSQARAVAGELLAHETTDEAYTALRLWCDRLDQYEVGQARRAADITPTARPRMVRPRNRVNPNPYRLYDTGETAPG